ncbi:protein RETARDED ROOT GROWTH, mitochondrial isoform X2 [Cryptomeria japonica]|uniref:protein RETARDED ROOT GROWTH, mitochondrial isoform X2 n=1 Tax=Cryptomeria japonica TaxID=3369 RepID=UPI0027DA1F25|nr:protein RETARDED ROOT GROWTH, mitochondrial isoform X2 [Cryptomeria japonica]
MLAASSARAALRPALSAFSCKHLVAWHKTQGLIISLSFYATWSKVSRRRNQGTNPLRDSGVKISICSSLSTLRSSHVRLASSSVPAMDEVEWNESGEKKKLAVDVNRELILEAQHQQHSRYIPVKAYFLSTSVDLRSLQLEHVLDIVPPASRTANYLIFKYTNTLSHQSSTSTLITQGIEGSKESWSSFHYMVVFQYGSVVLFNIAEQEEERYLEIVKKHASGLLSETRKDDYAVVEKPSLETWMQGGPDYIVMKRLDIDGIRIIGSVLGQSIALDHFVRQVDGMVGEFIDLNKGMEKTGTFTMKQKKLFQLVGKANSNLADVILKIGLFERSDIAWKNAKYAEIWEYLRDEYELIQRFGSLDFKLKFVEHNVRFFLEILENKKSDFLEWLIITLISAEILIAIYNTINK